MMKSLLFLILSLFTALTAQAQGEPQFLETFKPVERTHDFGTIYEKDGKVVHVFRLRNNGKRPVAISAVNTWCGCMVANYTKRAVRLWVKANIVPMVHPVREDHPFDYGHGLFMNQQMLPFPELTVGQTHTFELKLANDTDKPMTIQFKRVPNNTVLKMPSMVRLQPHERKSIHVSYLYFRRHHATRRIHVIPVVNGKEAKPLVVKWNVAQKFRLLN